jgi:hypothetical protein
MLLDDLLNAGQPDAAAWDPPCDVAATAEALEDEG